MFASPGPVAFHIGPLAIRWYGLLIATAVLLGTAIAYREARRRGEDPDRFLDVVTIALIGALVGSRLYYVAFNWDYYSQNLWKVLAIWEGGLAIHGGILGGIIGGGLYARKKGLNVLKNMDIVAPSLVLGQAIGRWGNFFNQEAFGIPTDLPWKLFVESAYRPPHLASYEYFHPTFLYESLWDFFVFLLLFLALRKPMEDTPGALFLSYLGLYSFGRFFIEGLRVDSLMLGGLRVAQVVSVVLLLGALGGLIWIYSKK